MPCCRCYKGSCTNCVCANLGRHCINCETSTCRNILKSTCDAESKSNPVIEMAISKPAAANPLKNRAYHTTGKPVITTTPDGKDILVPGHWTLYNGAIENAIAEMHRSNRPCLVTVGNSHIWHLAARMIKKTWFDTSQWQVDVMNVHQVENPVLYRRYLARRKEIQLSGGGRFPIVPVSRLTDMKEGFCTTLDYHFDELESSVNECLLLHGTSASAVGGIAQNGIDLRLANATGRYGSGIYLAESSIKSNVYTDFHRGEIHKLYALIVRTTLGRPFVCNVPHPFRRPPCAEPGCRSLDSCTIHRHFYDSVVGSSVMNQNTHREFVVYDPTQCLPEFIVTYSLWPANAPFTFK